MARPSVAPSNQWPERAPKRISAAAAQAFFDEDATTEDLHVVATPATATHSWMLYGGAYVVVPHRSDSRMVTGFGDGTLIATFTPEIKAAYIPGGTGLEDPVTVTRASVATFAGDPGTLASYAPGDALSVTRASEATFAHGF